MKQTLNFENDAYRRLCGEILERRRPGRWIICGSIAATLTAVAVSLTMAAGSSTAAVSSPVRANASEPDRVTAYAELPPEIITRTHTETVTVPVTQELVTVVQSQPETLPTVAAVQETDEPEAELLTAEQPVISWQNPDFAQNVLRTERYTFVISQDVFLVLDNETNKLVHFKDRIISNYAYRSMRWTGTKLLLYSDAGDSCLYSPDDNTYTTLDSREMAELVQYQWTCNGERYSFYAYDNTLYRRQESSGKETALYQNPKGLKISCISGSYLYLAEKTDSGNFFVGNTVVSRVNLLTGEKERLFNCDRFEYRGESGGDVIFRTRKDVHVHPDGSYTYSNSSSFIERLDSRATVTAYDRSEHTWTVDVTEELRKLVPDIEEWRMYNHIVEIDGDELFCCEMYSEIADMTGALSGSVVYIGRRTENGLVGGLHVFRDTPSSIIYADGHNAYYTKSTWNDSTGDYDTEIITIPYDHPATRDSAE